PMKITVRIVASFALLLVAGVSAQTPDKGGAPEKKTERAAEVLKGFKSPTDPKEAALAADWLEKSFADGPTPEAVKMLIAILRGSQMGPGEGWFGPAQTRYTWRWLATHCGDAKADAITKEQFKGPASAFHILDRNGDGRITPDDLDWSN